MDRLTDMSSGHERQIRRVLAEYCQLCDDGEFEKLVARFAPDGAFHFGGRTVEGHKALISWFEVTQAPAERGKHITSNAVIDIEGDLARVSSDFVFFGIVDGVLQLRIAGRYCDEFRRIDRRWVIKSREARVLRNPAAG